MDDNGLKTERENYLATFARLYFQIESRSPRYRTGCQRSLNIYSDIKIIIAWELIISNTVTLNVDNQQIFEFQAEIILMEFLS